MIKQQLRAHITKLLNENSRLDGRTLLEYRKPIKVEYGVTKNAEGSARVTIGDTIVMAGVKMEVMEPYPDAPDSGTIMVGAELLPLSNPKFELGPPGIQAIEIARIVDRGIRESKVLDFKKLGIKEGEKCWVACIDICPINDRGNLFDASALAAIAALIDTRMPKFDGKKADYKEKTNERLPLNGKPLSCTVFKIEDKYIVDPITEEEEVMDARLTVATMEDGSICAMQKGGETSLTLEQIEEMIDIGIKKTVELRKHL